MGLLEICLATACFNATVFNSSEVAEEDVIFSIGQKALKKLEQEIRGQHFYVTTLDNSPLSSINLSNNTGEGVAFDLLNILQRKYDFNYSIVKPKENHMGGVDTGVIKLLTSGEANISAAFLPMLGQFRKLIDYSPGLDVGEWVVLMKRPKESATGTGLLAPFSLPVWLLTLLSLIVVGPVIWLIVYLQDKLCRKERKKVFPIDACIWFVYGALLKQGSTLSPVSDSVRLLFASWWIFITILTAYYTANLTAFLTLSKFTLPITKPEDIGKKSWQWVTNKGNTLEDVLGLAYDTKIENPEEFISLARTLGRSARYANESDDLILSRYVTNRDWMFIRERPIIEHDMYNDYKDKTKKNIVEEDRCTFVVTSFAAAKFGRGFGFAKGFKFYPLLANAIQHLVESGIIQYKLREDLPDAEICPPNLGNKERRLRNSDLLMTYIIVGIGFGVAVGIFILEYILQRFFFKTKISMPAQKSNNIQLWYNNNKEYMKPKLTPPPPYNSLFKQTANENKKKKVINGREYWVVDSYGLIPVRAPSALLFQYTNY